MLSLVYNIQKCKKIKTYKHTIVTAIFKVNMT